MYLTKTPRFIQALFPRFTWRSETTEKVVHLTFDDGPIPEVTPWVLDQLDFYKAKATFFCVGDNVRKYPHIFEQVLDGGHQIGNHTFNHLNGWQTSIEEYTENIEKCANYVESSLFLSLIHISEPTRPY